MKKRLLPALTIGIAVILIGSIAYAADKRKSAKAHDRDIDKIREEEALTAELLNAVEAKEQKSHIHAESAPVDADKPGEKKEHVALTK